MKSNLKEKCDDKQALPFLLEWQELSSLPRAEQGASLLACAPPATRALLLPAPPGSGWSSHCPEHPSLLSVLSNLRASKKSTEASSSTSTDVSYVLLVFLSLTRVISAHPGDLSGTLHPQSAQAASSWVGCPLLPLPPATNLPFSCLVLAYLLHFEQLFVSFRIYTDRGNSETSRGEHDPSWSCPHTQAGGRWQTGTEDKCQVCVSLCLFHGELRKRGMEGKEKSISGRKKQIKRIKSASE